MNKKLLVITLFVSLICVTAGIGTMAWFTSSATSNNNEFIAGTIIIDGDNTTVPLPLFKTAYDDPYYSNFNVGLWYPGKEVLGDSDDPDNPERIYRIQNRGTLSAKVAGLSACVTMFSKDLDNYLIEDFNTWPIPVKDSYYEFVENLDIIVKGLGGEYFKGSLESLINDLQPLERKSDGYIITLNKTIGADLKLGAVMNTKADNKIQGVAATVDLIIHATQDNDEAVEALLNNNQR